MTAVQSHIRALAALKRSEAYERAGDYDNALKEAEESSSYANAWMAYLFRANVVAKYKKAA